MKYLDILKRNLAPPAAKLNMGSMYYFLQNNDLKHTARIVKEWLLKNCPKLLNTAPQSLDLNPIGNLWKEVKIQARNKKIRM